MVAVLATLLTIAGFTRAAQATLIPAASYSLETACSLASGTDDHTSTASGAATSGCAYAPGGDSASLAVTATPSVSASATGTAGNPDPLSNGYYAAGASLNGYYFFRVGTTTGTSADVNVTITGSLHGSRSGTIGLAFGTVGWGDPNAVGSGNTCLSGTGVCSYASLGAVCQGYWSPVFLPGDCANAGYAPNNDSFQTSVAVTVNQVYEIDLRVLALAGDGTSTVSLDPVVTLDTTGLANPADYTVQFSDSVSNVEVPEPGGAALLFTALAGLGTIRARGTADRRKRSLA